MCWQTTSGNNYFLHIVLVSFSKIFSGVSTVLFQNYSSKIEGNWNSTIPYLYLYITKRWNFLLRQTLTLYVVSWVTLYVPVTIVNTPKRPRISKMPLKISAYGTDVIKSDSESTDVDPIKSIELYQSKWLLNLLISWSPSLILCQFPLCLPPLGFVGDHMRNLHPTYKDISFNLQR